MTLSSFDDANFPVACQQQGTESASHEIINRTMVDIAQNPYVFEGKALQVHAVIIGDQVDCQPKMTKAA